MLYGITDREQRRLAREGKGIRVLIGYWVHWFPWYMRRLAERPVNIGFVLRSLLSRGSKCMDQIAGGYPPLSLS